jgi:hypothetical protein
MKKYDQDGNDAWKSFGENQDQSKSGYDGYYDEPFILIERYRRYKGSEHDCRLTPFIDKVFESTSGSPEDYDEDGPYDTRPIDRPFAAVGMIFAQSLAYSAAKSTETQHKNTSVFLTMDVDMACRLRNMRQSSG